MGKKNQQRIQVVPLFSNVVTFTHSANKYVTGAEEGGTDNNWDLMRCVVGRIFIIDLAKKWHEYNVTGHVS